MENNQIKRSTIIIVALTIGLFLVLKIAKLERQKGIGHETLKEATVLMNAFRLSIKNLDNRCKRQVDKEATKAMRQLLKLEKAKK